MDKKLYYQEYHRHTYQPKPNFCDVCSKDLTGSRKKRCDTCKIPCICIDCGKTFAYKVKYKRCPNCQYRWYKNNHNENHVKLYKRKNKEFVEKRSKELRDKLGLPHDAILRRSELCKDGYKNAKGYVQIFYKDEISQKYKYKYQHVLVMEDHLKRSLFPGETVHHLNGVRDDNRLENLELWNKAQPAGQRVEDRIKYYIEFLEQYGYKVSK
jgi:hypothetical protein